MSDDDPINLQALDWRSDRRSFTAIAARTASQAMHLRDKRATTVGVLSDWLLGPSLVAVMAMAWLLAARWQAASGIDPISTMEATLLSWAVGEQSLSSDQIVALVGGDR